MRIKKSIVTIAVVVSLFALISNGNTQGQSAALDHAKPMDATETAKDDRIQPTFGKEQSRRILAAYLEVKDALVKTNGELASATAKKLLEQLGDSKSELLDKIRFDAEHINETSDAGHQRDHFNTLSDSIYLLVKDDSPMDLPIYRQYCPMAMNNKGASWLSTEREIRNPYFGDRMLKCGSIKEEVN